MTRLKRNDPYWVYLKISEDPGWIFKPWLHRDTKKRKKKLREKRNKKKNWSKEDGQFFRRRKQTKNNSTFDPKIHKMSPHGLGYQMKDDVKPDPKESTGAVLKNILR